MHGTLFSYQSNGISSEVQKFLQNLPTCCTEVLFFTCMHICSRNGLCCTASHDENVPFLIFLLLTLKSNCANQKPDRGFAGILSRQWSKSIQGGIIFAWSSFRAEKAVEVDSALPIGLFCWSRKKWHSYVQYKL